MATPRPEPISRRNRPAKPPLSRAAIVAAAMQIAKADGSDAVTMRRVADALDTAAGSLYVYVANRGELISFMLDEAYGSVDLRLDESLPWQDQVVQLIERQIATLASYPGLALYSAGSIPVGEGAMRAGERMLTLLLGGGIEPARVAWGIDLLGLYATAAAIEQSAYFVRESTEQLVERDYVEEVRERYQALDPRQYPHATGMIDLLLNGTGDERQRWAIQVLLAGIANTPTSAQ